MKTALKTIVTMIALTSSAFAASGAESEANGILVYLFLGLGALIIAFQLLPGLTLFASMIKGLFSAKSDETTH
ncbi:hypothetical protein GURASL_10150 [Geotalea uraniireducens]|uniref:Uncharacterized protein n=1 Tax=Geotalea uraniireducens TaxID=351604 RepID=A0ABN6VRX8_9BACT|nr:hypothetical protein [Geotalea uraniireducens]BDV42092.1 hypothetical protein GURASL_10150 [Geotalea uraniireducens]